MSTPEVRWGFIGAGNIARTALAPAVHAATGARLQAVAARDPERGRSLSPHGTSYDHYGALLSDPDVDAVYISLSNEQHAPWSILALEAGKHVLCEKPMAVSGADARLMVETAKRTGKKLSVGFQNRFRPENQFLKAAIDEGQLGEVYAGKAHAVRRRGVPTWGVFTDKEKQGGGPLIDLGGHAIDLALWFMDNYSLASVTGVVNHKLADKPAGNMMGPWDPASYTVEDSAFGFVRFTNGASLYVESSWALNVADSREACVTLCGTDGGADTVQVAGSQNLKVTLNNVVGGQLVTTSPEVGAAVFMPGKPVLSPMEKSSADEAETWLEAILTDGDPVVTAEQACVVTEILDAMYVSARTGKPVYFNGAGESDVTD